MFHLTFRSRKFIYFTHCVSFGDMDAPSYPSPLNSATVSRVLLFPWCLTVLSLYCIFSTGIQHHILYLRFYLLIFVVFHYLCVLAWVRGCVLHHLSTNLLYICFVVLPTKTSRMLSYAFIETIIANHHICVVFHLTDGGEFRW